MTISSLPGIFHLRSLETTRYRISQSQFMMSLLLTLGYSSLALNAVSAFQPYLSVPWSFCASPTLLGPHAFPAALSHLLMSPMDNSDLPRYEMPHETADYASAAPVIPHCHDTSMPRRKGKNKSTTRKMRKRKEPPANIPVTEEELSNHISQIYGRGSPPEIVRRRNTKSAQKAMDSAASNPNHMQQVTHLRQLDNHPALVLNADYQVSRNKLRKVSRLGYHLLLPTGAGRERFCSKSKHQLIYINTVAVRSPCVNVVSLVA